MSRKAKLKLKQRGPAIGAALGAASGGGSAPKRRHVLETGILKGKKRGQDELESHKPKPIGGGKKRPRPMDEREKEYHALHERQRAKVMAIEHSRLETGRRRAQGPVQIAAPTFTGPLPPPPPVSIEGYLSKWGLSEEGSMETEHSVQQQGTTEAAMQQAKPQAEGGAQDLPLNNRFAALLDMDDEDQASSGTASSVVTFQPATFQPPPLLPDLTGLGKAKDLRQLQERESMFQQRTNSAFESRTEAPTALGRDKEDDDHDDSSDDERTGSQRKDRQGSTKVQAPIAAPSTSVSSTTVASASSASTASTSTKELVSVPFFTVPSDNISTMREWGSPAPCFSAVKITGGFGATAQTFFAPTREVAEAQAKPSSLCAAGDSMKSGAATIRSIGSVSGMGAGADGVRGWEGSTVQEGPGRDTYDFRDL